MSTIYITTCTGICGQDIGHDFPEPTACWACAPHICIPVPFEEDMCDLCLRKIPFDPSSTPSLYCKHGNYIGTPYGPDYICGYCEMGD